MFVKPAKQSPKAKPLSSPDGKPVKGFSSPVDFEAWLAKNHVGHTGIWLRMFKKGSGRATVTYAEALEVALCYGWIDGQTRGGHPEYYIQKFTPRGARSIWSRINTGHVERLTKLGRMKPAGLAAVEAAKADGRWNAAYSSFGSFEMPSEFMEALARKKKAAAFFATLNKRNRYAIYHRLTTAKRAETRTRKSGEFIAMLERGETFH